MNPGRKLTAAIAVIGLSATSSLSPAAAQQPNWPITAEWFAGTWSDNADCRRPVVFLRDGSYRTPDGDVARWRIERGNVLVLIGGENRQELALVRVNDRQVRTVDGGVASYRCGGGASAPAAQSDAPVTAGWLIGTWSDLRDCSRPFYIERDGDFREPNGGVGRWQLDSDRLSLTFGQNRRTGRLIRVGQDELKLAETGVSSYRCS